MPPISFRDNSVYEQNEEQKSATRQLMLIKTDFSLNENVSAPPEKGSSISKLEDNMESQDYSFRQANEIQPLTEALNFDCQPRASAVVSQSHKNEIEARGGARDI